VGWINFLSFAPLSALDGILAALSPETKF